MPDAHGASPQEPWAGGVVRARTLFISDIHLGARRCQAAALLEFLTACEADRIYLVGDIVDGWRLKARWHWPRSHDNIVRCLLAKMQAGTRILYIPGNHDEFLRNSIGLRLGGIEVVDHAIHEGADGRRHLVVHGDEFDSVVAHMRRLAALGIWVYAAAVLANDAGLGLWRRLRRAAGLPARSARAKTAFERLAVAAAREHGVQGVICGHVHRPGIREVQGVTYVNTGDWMDSRSAVVEHADGRLEVLRWPAASVAPAAVVDFAAAEAWPGLSVG